MVDSMDGCLIAAIGQKVFIHDLNENDIRATGFVDTQIYTHCSQTFKHFCLVGDIQQARVVYVHFEVVTFFKLFMSLEFPVGNIITGR